MIYDCELTDLRTNTTTIVSVDILVEGLLPSKYTVCRAYHAKYEHSYRTIGEVMSNCKVKLQ